ncbi:PhoH family protein [Bacteroidota bacterium]
MIEKTIYLEGIDPVIFFGPNNSNLNLIEKFFSKLKLICRGDTIKAIGHEKEILLFENKVLQLINHFNKYNSLNETDTIRVLSTNQDQDEKPAGTNNTIVFGNHGKAIKARNDSQKIMVKKYKSCDLIFSIGPAGTGKTYMAIALAVNALKNKEVKRIILSRPAVEAGEHLGFLPGDLKEKLDPYLQPLYDALNDMIPPKKLSEHFENRIIQIAPLAFMRGRTLSNSVVILDEAQNATPIQMKMFLTRMGENSKFIVTGDITQIDLPPKSESGLVQASEMLQNIKGIGIINFSSKDIIRHKLVIDIIKAYNEKNNKKISK